VLIARAARARDVLPDALRGAGCTVDVVTAYETRPPSPSVVDALTRELEGGRLDAVTFTSSSTVDNLCDLLGPRANDLLAGVRVASIGPVTTATATGRGLRVDVTAREYTVAGLVDALVASYSV
jgi:uroporphyrinogen III methyltransferase/synthase